MSARRALALLACCLHWGALAEGREEPNWYTVELLVFRHLDVVDSEGFPLLPALAYPRPLQALSLGPAMRAPERPFWLPRAEDFSADGGPGDPAPAGFEPGARAPGLLVPVAFALLPETARRFNSGRIDRRPDMRVLFHEAWRQPLPERARARHILIHSRHDGGYPELQGSILLYAERYLHLATNLWLNRRRADLPDGWSMPAPPLPPSQTAAPEPQLHARFDSPPAGERASPPQMAAPEPQLHAQFDSPPASELASPPPPSGAGQAEPGAAPERPPGQPAGARPEDYRPYNHALLLEQRRRMRIGEAHYLDHPQFGVVIRLTAYEFSQSPAAADSSAPLRPAAQRPPAPR